MEYLPPKQTCGEYSEYWNVTNSATMRFGALLGETSINVELLYIL